MSGNISRRDFLRTSAVGASAVALSAGVARGFPANEKVQLGWVGIGGRGTSLLQMMTNGCGDARTAAVCDIRDDRLAAAQAIAGRDRPKGYKDFREMLDKEKLDGVLVATEPGNHAPIVVPVLERGINCFAEKPMDITVEKVDAITKAARASKGFYQIGTQRRYHPGYISAMKFIHSGDIGKIIFLQGQWHWTWEPANNRTARDGGELIEQAGHHVDVMMWAMGNQAPVRCVSMGYNQLGKDPNTYSESQSATVFQFASGVLLSYTHVFYLAPHFEAEKLQVHCEKGGVDLGEGMFYGRGTGEYPEGDERKVGRFTGRDWMMGTQEELCSFVAQIKSDGKQKPRADVETGRVSTLMTIMGRMAMADPAKNAYEPRVISWKDLGTKTDPS